MGDSDLSHKRRICSGLRSKRTTRAYDLTLTDAGFLVKMKTSLAYTLKRFARDQTRRPRKVKLKPRNKPLLMTPLRNIRSLTTIVRANWNPRIRNQGAKPTYVFPADYAAPVKSLEYLGGSNPNKEYLGFFGEEEKKKPKPEEEQPTAYIDNLRKIVEKEINESYRQAA